MKEHIRQAAIIAMGCESHPEDEAVPEIVAPGLEIHRVGFILRPRHLTEMSAHEVFQDVFAARSGELFERRVGNHWWLQESADGGKVTISILRQRTAPPIPADIAYQEEPLPERAASIVPVGAWNERVTQEERLRIRALELSLQWSDKQTQAEEVARSAEVFHDFLTGARTFSEPPTISRTAKAA